MVNSDQKLAAYTTVRADVCEMVPSTALKILDVGCSNGALGRSLMAGNPARIVDGIERDPTLVSAARNVLNAAIEVDLETFQWGDDAPLGKYDCIIFADVLEHLVDPARHLAGARRHLHRNGSIVVSFPNIRHITVMNSIFLRGTFPQNDRGLFDRTHLRWFTLRDMKAMLAASGFRVAATDGSLRFRDQGGGLLNKGGQRLLDPLRKTFLVREFFTYQFCIRAVDAATGPAGKSAAIA